MTPDELALLTASATVALADRNRFAASFYEHLLVVDPRTAALFPADVGQQRTELVAELEHFVGAAADLGAFVERARDLGRRHACDGVEPASFEHAHAALFAALADALGPDWTPAHAAAWGKFYCLMAETMLDGAATGMFCRRSVDPAQGFSVRGCA